jgi:monoamine oxidase
VTADVLVIGGGFAGLVAARDLAAAGRAVVVLEARPRLGGRTWYRPFLDSDVQVELGGAWFSLRRQPALAEEVERYGVSVVPVPERRRQRWFTGGTRRRGRPVPKGEAETLRRTLAELAARGRAAGSEDDVSVAEWMAGLGVPRATRDFVLGWASFMSGADPSGISMLEVMALVAEGDGSPGSLADEIGEQFEHGSAALLDAIASDSGADIRLGAPVVRVSQDADRIEATLADGARIGAGAAVLAVPLNTLGAIELDPPLDRELAALVVEGHPGCSRKLWLLAEGAPEGLACVGYGTPFNWLSWEGRVGDRSLLVSFAKEDVTDPEAAVAAYAPGTKVLAVDTHDWGADPWSRGTWLTSRPGWTLSGELNGFLRPHGRVVFAGSDVGDEHPGWIAGAIASGRSAARRVLAVVSAPGRV